MEQGLGPAAEGSRPAAPPHPHPHPLPSPGLCLSLEECRSSRTLSPDPCEMGQAVRGQGGMASSWRKVDLGWIHRRNCPL